MKINQVVVDASVVGKWFFPEENDSGKALELKNDLVKENISLIEPELLYYEISNLLKSAVKGLRIDPGQAVTAFQGILEIDLTVYSSKKVLEAALELAVKYDISTYDAVYLALSQYLSVPFITADRKLLAKIPESLAMDLGDYPVGKDRI